MRNSLHFPNSLYLQAGLYDAQYATAAHDFRFYTKLAAQTGGPILELGAGTGRLTLALARAGFRVTALDASEAMLKQARTNLGMAQQPVTPSGRDASPRRPRTARRAVPTRYPKDAVQFVRVDFRAFHLAQRFPFIVCAFNSLQHCVKDEDLVAVLARVREHLIADGVFAFDVANHPAEHPQPGEPRPALRERFYDERTGQACEVWETCEGPTGPGRTLTWEYRWADGRTQRENLTLRAFAPSELRGWLDAGGFRMLQQLGDFNGASFSPVSSKQIFVCQLK